MHFFLFVPRVEHGLGGVLKRLRRHDPLPSCASRKQRYRSIGCPAAPAVLRRGKNDMHNSRGGVGSHPPPMATPAQPACRGAQSWPTPAARTSQAHGSWFIHVSATQRPVPIEQASAHCRPGQLTDHASSLRITPAHWITHQRRPCPWTHKIPLLGLAGWLAHAKLPAS